MSDLDNPIWAALTSAHRALAEGGDLARRYPAEVAPFAAVVDDSPAAIDALCRLAAAGPLVMNTAVPLAPIEGLDASMQSVVRQMIWQREPARESEAGLVPLGLPDVPAMLELTALTRPGPFFSRTYELGGYVGYHNGDQLVAMAGERMRLDGFTEISAVCVHPDHRGRGYGQRLINILGRRIVERGETPFLHVLDQNHGAIGLYEHLGFVTRAKLHLVRLGVQGSTR